ncbi:MAG: Ger(x)C family spore germination protein [Limnochordia bacterium]|jgi:spore germination protein KC|nr:Ger(x)C family spore germination protein [Limnochordia bacterium]MDD2628871.1 Ger(x)C family spore germination protein [Limnochordia bacterium]MDD4516998.1 Ger(x)C family spore germination protein [Limnochordia bacterium]
MSIRTRRLVLVVLILMMFLTSCWNRREIETLGFVLAVGVDKAAEEGKIMLSVQIAKPFALAGPSVVAERPFWLVSSTGYTVFEAIRNFLSQSPRRPFWAHNRFILIGEELAREGIMEIIDLFARDGESRRTVQVVIVKGAKAVDLLQAEFELERLPSEGAQGILLGSLAGLGTTVGTELNDLLQMLELPGMEPVALRAEIVDRPPDVDLRGQSKRDVISTSARLSGAAVFKKDKLVGWLGPKQTRGLLWIKGEIKGTVLVVEYPNEQDRLITVEVIRASSKVTPKIIDGKPQIKIEINVEGNLGETQVFFDPITQLEKWASIERRVAEAIRGEVQSVLDAAQKEYKSDIFGFGTSFYRNYYKEWERMQADWDRLFQELAVEIDIRTGLRRSGLAVRGFLDI